MYLTLSPNSYVETNISENDGMRAIKKVKGSISTNEYIENSINSSRLNAKKETYTPSYLCQDYQIQIIKE